eukprot:12894187-Prorocentrum_lima.AAC.1
MSSVLWDSEHPMYVWDAAASCYITSFDEEELEIGGVEFYLPLVLAHWHISCPHALNASEQLVLT